MKSKKVLLGLMLGALSNTNASSITSISEEGSSPSATQKDIRTRMAEKRQDLQNKRTKTSVLWYRAEKAAAIAKKATEEAQKLK